jgi:hypothetical protein
MPGHDANAPVVGAVGANGEVGDVVDDSGDSPVEGMAVVTGSDVVTDVIGGSGLTPALPISNEPNGIPVRAAPPGVVGDVAAADEALLPDVVPHGPDIAVLPGIDAPIPMPIPPPSNVVPVPDVADDALPVVVQGNGLSPGEASCVAPMGIPVGATDEPGVMPSGEVGPIVGVGLPIPPTCADAELQPRRIAVVAIIRKRVIVASTLFFIGICGAPLGGPTQRIMNRMPGHGFARIAGVCRILRRSELVESAHRFCSLW